MLLLFGQRVFLLSIWYPIRIPAVKRFGAAAAGSRMGFFNVSHCGHY
jgi:hypothetical protein